MKSSVNEKEIRDILKRLLFALILALAVSAHAGVSVRTVDFLQEADVAVNGAGPFIVRIDESHGRLIAVNTLSSSLSIIDCATGTVVNIPTGGRAFQHLKSECLTFSRKSGDIYLIGIECFYIIYPRKRSSETIQTGVQFESIAVDETTGNVFLAGCESRKLGFYKASSKKMNWLKWLDTEETLINLNATPPPPVRKVISDVAAGQIIAIDGIEPALYVFDGASGRLISSRPLGLAGGGRWHLGGYNEKSRALFIVTETDRRKVIEAAKISVDDTCDIVVPLPGYTEGVGIIYNPERDEVYIPYDNHPSVHVAGFGDGGSLEEIMIPAYGNDAAVIDLENDLLYVASWAFSEIDIIDLKTRRLKKRATGLGLIPHMFAMAYNPGNGLIYFPRGASAVNGTFGAAICVFDPESEKVSKIYTGWAPIDLVEMKTRGSFLVFNSEDAFAEVWPDGRFETHRLPYDYPVNAVHNPEGGVYLSYGPHQSYWPAVYIWDAKNGVLTIDACDLGFYDRRIPRQAIQMVLGREGTLYFTQNNWGKEEQFLGIMKDQIRLFNIGERIRLEDEVEKEITQRVLRYDYEPHLLYLVRVGEKDSDPSILQVIDPDSSRVVRKVELGLTATDLVFDSEKIYVSNFGSGSISVIDKMDFSVEDIEAGKSPLKLCLCDGNVYAIDHLGNSLWEAGRNGKNWNLPFKGLPDNIFEWNDKLVITSHDRKSLFIVQFDPASRRYELLHREDYPFGDTGVDSGNVSFYMRGQFGDAVLSITKGRVDSEGRLWITDFLSGKLFILQRQ